MAETGPLTKGEIEQYLELDERRRGAGRLKSDLEKELEPLDEKIAAYITQHGGSDRTTVHHGFVLRFGQRKTQPSWLREFIAAQGQKEADRLRKAAPMADYVVVEPAVS